MNVAIHYVDQDYEDYFDAPEKDLQRREDEDARRLQRKHYTGDYLPEL